MFYPAVPDIRVPDVTVNENQNAEVCILISNEIERSLMAQFSTGEVENGANGMFLLFSVLLVLLRSIGSTILKTMP